MNGSAKEALMESEATKLRRKIEQLEKVIEKQNAIIDALVEKNILLRRDQGGDDAASALKILSVKQEEGEKGSGEAFNFEGYEYGEAANPDGRREKNEPGDFDSQLIEAKKEIFSLINENRQENPVVFKMNFTFEEFFAYCGGFFFNAKTDFSKVKINSGLKNFVELNKKALIFHFFENLNKLRIGESFCFLGILSRIADFPLKMTLVYNTAVTLSNPYLFLHFAFAILNGEVLGDSVLETTLKKILNFQLSIESDVFVEDEIRESLEIISKALRLSKEKADLAKHAVELVEKMEFDLQNMGLGNENEILSVQLVCVFLDWEWSFESLVRKHLFPEFFRKNDPKLLFVIGTIACLGLALVERHESVVLIFNEMKKLMNNEASDVKISAVAYFFVKRVDSEFSFKWLRENRAKIEASDEILLEKIEQRPTLF